VLSDHLVQRDPRDPKAARVHLEPMEIQEHRALVDSQAPKDHRVQRATLDLRDLVVRMDNRDL